MDEKPEDAPKAEKPDTRKVRLWRCMDWLESQNNGETRKSLVNEDNLQFLIQTNKEDNDSLLEAGDNATVPAGVDELPVDPKPVPLHRLRVEGLRFECEWLACRWYFGDYEQFQKHVSAHVNDFHILEKDGGDAYVCLWDVCGHSTPNYDEMVRHINYHAYHTRLLAIGFNGRATLKLVRCKKDSSKRNQLPPLLSDHCCMWTGCDEKFNAVQSFFDHVKCHIAGLDEFVCSWAGCGAKFPRRVLLTMHVRSHTREKLIACYHCGKHFASNRKLADHLRRQNVDPNSGYTCPMCGVACATAYLVNEHARQHVSEHACTLCDMTAPSLAALAYHMRYRHLDGPDVRAHACPHCPYRAITKKDLNKHIPTHTRKKRKRGRKYQENYGSEEITDDDSDTEIRKKKKEVKKYACHMCPENNMKVFSRGTRLTTHLVKVHGAQWPFGHSRFRYQISEDGMYRLTTTRIELLEVSKKIVDGYSGPKESISNNFKFDIKLKAKATENTPTSFEIILKNDDDQNNDDIKKSVEITMCDVDDKGNIINTKVIESDVL